jgi:hypothetical protein
MRFFVTLATSFRFVRVIAPYFNLSTDSDFASQGWAQRQGDEINLLPTADGKVLTTVVDARRRSIQLYEIRG